MPVSSTPQGGTLLKIGRLLKESAVRWNDDKVPKLAAALSYYMAISIAPLLILAIKVIGVMYGQAAAADKLRGPLSRITSPHIATLLQGIITKAGKPGSGALAAILSIILAVFGASSVFAELQDSLNTIWGVRPRPDRGIWGIVRDRSLSVAMVLTIALLLGLSIVLNAIFTASSGYIIRHLFGTAGLLKQGATFAIVFIFAAVLMAMMFAALFRWLPDVKMHWKDVILGALVTGVLFELGKIGLNVYLANASPGSAYGAASSLVVVIVWVYYSSLIFYYGAEFTRCYADQFGDKIVPTKHAIWIDECDPDRLPAHPGASPMIKEPAQLNVLVTKARAEFLRQQKYLARCRERGSIAKPKRRNAVVIVAASTAAISSAVLGRFAYKRIRGHSKPRTLRAKWAAAFSKWGRAASLLGAGKSKRYAATHGPQGAEGPSWAEVLHDRE